MVKLEQMDAHRASVPSHLRRLNTLRTALHVQHAPLGVTQSMGCGSTGGVVPVPTAPRNCAGVLLFLHVIVQLSDKEPAASAQVAAEGIGTIGDYADLYLRTSYDLCRVFKAREGKKVGEAASIAAKRKAAGGKIFSRVGTPHIMWGGACAADVPGHPGLAPDPQRDFGQGTQPAWMPGAEPALTRENAPGLDELRSGDVAFAAQPSPAVSAAVERGVYVIGLGYPMTTNKYSPPGFNDFPDPPHIDDICSVFLYSWVSPALRLTRKVEIQHAKVC